MARARTGTSTWARVASAPRGLAHLLAHPRLREKPFVLETPGMDDGYDAINLERCRMLLAGEPLPKLPPAAFQLSRRTAGVRAGGR